MPSLAVDMDQLMEDLAEAVWSASQLEESDVSMTVRAQYLRFVYEWLDNYPEDAVEMLRDALDTLHFRRMGKSL